jgi:hypothetical protein
LNVTTISPALSVFSVASCGSCLYLIFASILVGSLCSFLIQCRPVVVIVFPNNDLSSLSPTVTVFSFTSVFNTYALKGKLSPCLWPMVKKYAHSCFPTTFPSVLIMLPSFLGNFFNKKSLIGIFPIKHNH